MIPAWSCAISRSCTVQNASLSTSGPDASVICNANAIPCPAVAGRIYSYASGGGRLKSALPSAIRACAGSIPDGARVLISKNESDDCHYVVTLPTQIFLDATFAEIATRRPASLVWLREVYSKG